jgi:cyanoexosortase B
MFTCLYAGLILIYWTKLWHSRFKTILFSLGIIVVSIISNIIRNTILTFFHGTGQDAAFKWLHDSWGGDLYSTVVLVLLIPLFKGVERWSEWSSQVFSFSISDDSIEPD